MGNCVGAICTNGFKPLRNHKGMEMEEFVTEVGRPLISISEEKEKEKEEDDSSTSVVAEELRSKQSIINIAGKRMRVKMKLKVGDHHHYHHHQELLGSRSSRTVRIRVVMSQKELMKILDDGSNYSSVDHLLNAIKLKNNTRVISSCTGGGTSSSWKPALDSIKEDI